MCCIAAIVLVRNMRRCGYAINSCKIWRNIALAAGFTEQDLFPFAANSHALCSPHYHTVFLISKLALRLEPTLYRFFEEPFQTTYVI